MLTKKRHATRKFPPFHNFFNGPFLSNMLLLTLVHSLLNVLVFSCVSFVGGLFIFSIRCDSYDPVEYGYSATCEKLEKSGKWKLILKEKRELHSTPNEERYRYCYLITYQVLQ